MEIDLEGMGGGTRERQMTGGTRSFAFSHLGIGAGARIVTSTNSPRFTAAAIGGFVNPKLARTDHPSDGESVVTGAPTGFLQIEAGGQFDFSRSIALETVAFIGLLGLSSKDFATENTVMTRGGLKLAMQFSF